MQIRKASWHAHVPRVIGVPSGFRLDAAASRRYRRREADGYVFDFTGMTPLPSDDLDRRLLVLLDEIERFRWHHPEVLDRLGIDIQVAFRDDTQV